MNKRTSDDSDCFASQASPISDVPRLPPHHFRPAVIGITDLHTGHSGANGISEVETKLGHHFFPTSIEGTIPNWYIR